jgi:hypothetical protein
MTSSTAAGSGNNFSGSVWLPKGTTLKGVMLISGSVVNKKFYSTSHITFWTLLVLYILSGDLTVILIPVCGMQKLWKDWQ